MCRADCAENDAETECDQTGEPCMARQVMLEAANQAAWDLYWRARLPGSVPQILMALRRVELSEYDADALAIKIEHLAGTIAELENEKMKKAQEDAKRR